MIEVTLDGASDWGFGVALQNGQYTNQLEMRRQGRRVDVCRVVSKRIPEGSQLLAGGKRSATTGIVQGSCCIPEGCHLSSLRDDRHTNAVYRWWRSAYHRLIAWICCARVSRPRTLMTAQRSPFRAVLEDDLCAAVLIDVETTPWSYGRRGQRPAPSACGGVGDGRRRYNRDPHARSCVVS
jgi:hypothetical protein